MEIISKADAISAGLRHYFTGKPCRRGHLSQRYTSIRKCVDCSKEDKVRRDIEKRDQVLAERRKWYALNAESVRQRNRLHYQDNRETYNERSRRWKAQNADHIKAYWSKIIVERRDKILDQQKQYRIANPEKIKAKRLRYYDANRDKELSQNKVWRSENSHIMRFHGSKRRAKKHSATPKWADYNAMKEIYAKARKMREETGIMWVVDHVIPIQGATVSGLHCEQNLQIITRSENSRKGNRYWPDMP